MRSVTTLAPITDTRVCFSFNTDKCRKQPANVAHQYHRLMVSGPWLYAWATTEAPPAAVGADSGGDGLQWRWVRGPGDRPWLRTNADEHPPPLGAIMDAMRAGMDAAGVPPPPWQSSTVAWVGGRLVRVPLGHWDPDARRWHWAVRPGGIVAQRSGAVRKANDGAVHERSGTEEGAARLGHGASDTDQPTETPGLFA